MNTLLLKTWEHLELTFVTLFISMFIAIPLGVFLARSKARHSHLILRSIAMIQMVPGLALIALIVVILAALRAFFPLPTTGKVPAVIVLVLYALLPIMSNTYAGIKQVSVNVKNVARAMGMKPFQILFYVELPLSMPILINGIRIALVTTIGMVTLTSLIGSGGLGELIIQGLHTMQLRLILEGTIPAAALAIFFDVVLMRVGRYLVPEHGSYQ
ncbi:MAG: Choline transport system permease protein OpuBB [Chlamydiae bacterium]|nr:Choline transport system permease protein OpuBB [Chlamydiota bacterium]